MKKRLLAILGVLVVMISLTNSGVSVQAATHTHEYKFYKADIIGDGYNISGHYIKTTTYFKCSCGSETQSTSRTLQSHSLSRTDYHNGTKHTFGDSCGVCGWSNITTYSCPGGNGGKCITPYFVH